MSGTILFVSSNYTWGGSEILWSETAGQMISQGYKIKFAVKYDKPIIQTLKNKGADYINLSKISKPLSYKKRILQKLKIKKYKQKEIFLKNLLCEKPKLVIISQGNNIDGNYYMSICRQLSIPFVTITQLVTEILWEFNDDEIINELRLNYVNSKKNFFVSHDNLVLHNTMMGEELPNSKVVSNPFTVPVNVEKQFPDTNDQYSIALVGRLDTYHKGHDILLKVLQQQKWKHRPVKFNFYGTGPHKMLLERLIMQYEIKNVFFKGHTNDVAEIWKQNQLLVLPSRMEGQSLALIEALWCYRGAVVTNVGGAKQLITDELTGFIANSPTFEEMDKALEKAWLFRDKWEEIGYNAGERIRKVFTEHPILSFTKKIENIITALN